MKKTLFTINLCLFSIFAVSQTLNPTHLINTPGAADAFKGGYTFAYATSGTPWNGALISYGGLSNLYDIQMNSDYGVGNHLSFRTRNGDFNNGIGKWNGWNEIWHSGNLNNALTDFTSKNLSINGLVDINANGSFPIIRGNGGYIPAGLVFQDDSYSSSGQVKKWAIWKGNTWQKGLGFMIYDAVNACGGGICDIPLMLFDDGNVSIGISQKQITIPAKLSIADNVKIDAKLEAKEVKVTTTPTADFVFEKDYHLPTLEDVENFITENKHLPDIASAKVMNEEGVNIGEFQIQLLQKIEELTLYSIEQNKKIQSLEKENYLLQSLSKRVEGLEKSLQAIK